MHMTLVNVKHGQLSFYPSHHKTVLHLNISALLAALRWHVPSESFGILTHVEGLFQIRQSVSPHETSRCHRAIKLLQVIGCPCQSRQHVRVSTFPLFNRCLMDLALVDLTSFLQVHQQLLLICLAVSTDLQEQ